MDDPQGRWSARLIQGIKEMGRRVRGVAGVRMCGLVSVSVGGAVLEDFGWEASLACPLRKSCLAALPSSVSVRTCVSTAGGSSKWRHDRAGVDAHW